MYSKNINIINIFLDLWIFILLSKNMHTKGFLTDQIRKHYYYLSILVFILIQY